MAVVEQLLGEVEEVQAEVDQRADAVATVDADVVLVAGASRAVWSPPPPAARRFAAQYSRPFSATKESVPRAASRRLRIASMTFDQLGQLASSRSANQTLAPELSALMAILAGVAGPGHLDPAVEQRGRRGGDLPLALPDRRGLGQEVKSAGGRRLLAANRARGQQLVATAGEALVQLLEKASASGVRISLARSTGFGSVSSIAMTTSFSKKRWQ